VSASRGEPARAPTRSWLAAGALGAALLVAALGVTRPAALVALDGRVYDALVRHARLGAGSGLVAIVDVDERSLVRLGRWPWPRSRLALVLTRLQALGVKAVALDMMLSEPDERAADDLALATALAAGPAVVGHAFTFGAAPGGAVCALHPLPAARLEAPVASAPLGLFRASGVVCTLPDLARAAAGSGFLNAAPDPDGIVRRLPMLVAYQDGLYPSLALATFLRTSGPRQVVLRATEDGLALALDDVVVPLDPQGTMLLRFRGGKGSFPVVSAVDVVDGRLPDGALRGRVALVGASALGLDDRVATPVDTTLPGVELHATVLDELLRRDFVRRPPLARALELGLALGASGLAALTVVMVGLPWSVPVLLGAGAALWWGALWALDARGVVVSPLLPWLALGGSFGALGLVRYVGEHGRADRATRDLRQARELMLQALTSLTETRDNETGAHLLRTRRYMQALCAAVAPHPRFRALLDPEVVDLLVQLAPIHDIGKVGIADRTLHKPGPLDDAERAEMRRHPALGRDVIANAERRVGMVDDQFLGLAKDVVYAHHERWDGTGYPEGLRGDAIPPAGRLVALVDVYDALASRRVYKDGLSHDQVVGAIAAGRGTQFDPDVVDAFLRVHEEWRQIARELADDGSDRTHP
jgi:CHASE2 domain-containing sensor protein